MESKQNKLKSNVKSKVEKTFPIVVRSKPVNQNSRSQYFVNRALRAAKEHKIFTIHYNGQSRIRNILRHRGWVEKCSPRYLRSLQQLSDQKIFIHARNGNDYEVIAMSRACKSISPNFVWHPSSFQNVTGMPYRNRVQRSARFNFTSKDGLLGCIENSYWYTIEGLSEIRSPRYHRLFVNDERIEFLKDYRTTYCLSLLKFISEYKDPLQLFQNSAYLPISLIDFAANRVKTEMRYMINEDDSLDTDANNVEIYANNSHEWINFYKNIDSLINRQEKFKINHINEALDAILTCKDLHNDAKLFWPTLSSDGYNNLWIIKPSYWCRGNGIVIKKNYSDIINFVNSRKNIRYIVQKYIERPLLIYKVKFDIRQYILLAITSQYINIWMYKNCYLRFSSQEYQLNNLQQSIHITNNAVQKRYTNGKRNYRLPVHNMWSLDEFKKYLIDINEIDTWDNQIYPSMKKNIMAVLLTSLEETEIVPNAFEIYGADFMIDENFESILLEINANPDMSCSTKVTGKICPTAINDLLKVILDYPRNPNAFTGNFELIHSIEYIKSETKLEPNDMVINGRAITLLQQPILSPIPRKYKLFNNLPTNTTNFVNAIKNNKFRQIHNKIKKIITHSKSKSNSNNNKNKNIADNHFQSINRNSKEKNQNEDSNFIIKIVDSINNYGNNPENIEKILKNIENKLLTTEQNSNKLENNYKAISHHFNNNQIRTDLVKKVYPIFLNKSKNKSIHNKNKKNYQLNKYHKYLMNKPPSQNEHEIVISKESFMKLKRNDNNSLVPTIPVSVFNNIDSNKKSIINNGNLKIRLTSDLKEAFSLGAIEH